MLKYSEETVLQAFEAVHGKMTGSCYAEIIHDEDDISEIVGVACMKDGNECWRATLAELSFDLLMLWSAQNDKPEQTQTGC